MKKSLRSSAVRTLIGILIIFSGLILIEYLYSKNRVPLGLYLGETYIGGISYKQLDQYLEETDLQNHSAVFFTPQELKFKYKLGDLGISFDRDKTVGEIRVAGMPFDFRNKYALWRFGGIIQPKIKIDESKLNAVMNELEHPIKVEERDAAVWADGGELMFRPHLHGTNLDRKEFSALLLAELSAWPVPESELALPLKQRKAGETVSSILENGIKDKLYTVTTHFNQADENRVHNIILASEQVNNIILKPGDMFSFNELVGEASLECGYKEAPVIVNKELVMGAGGGICQVSSTLYNGALMTGMTIVERYNHSLPVAYLPPGLDATVAYDYLDLKFANELDTHILVNTEVEHNELHVTIFGNASVIGEIEVVRQDLTVIPPPVEYHIAHGRPSWYREIIQEGKPGYKVETLRIYYEDEKEISRESLGKDYYGPVPYIYAVGDMPDNSDN